MCVLTNIRGAINQSCVTRLFYVRDTFLSCTLHDAYMYVTCFIHVGDRICMHNHHPL